MSTEEGGSITIDARKRKRTVSEITAGNVDVPNSDILISRTAAQAIANTGADSSLVSANANAAISSTNADVSIESAAIDGGDVSGVAGTIDVSAATANVGNLTDDTSETPSTSNANYTSETPSTSSNKHTFEKPVTSNDTHTSETPSTSSAKDTSETPSTVSTSGLDSETTPEKAAVKFESIGAFSTLLFRHGRFCSSYVPGDRQRAKKGRLCCKELDGGISMNAEIAESNRCCGTKDRLVLRREDTHSLIGYLDCHFAAFLAPLVREGVIEVTSEIGCMVHPIGGAPPITVYVSGNISWLETNKKDQKWGPLVQAVAKEMGKSHTDWIEGLDVDEDVIARFADDSIDSRKCTCSQGYCFCRDS